MADTTDPKTLLNNVVADATKLAADATQLSADAVQLSSDVKKLQDALAGAPTPTYAIIVSPPEVTVGQTVTIKWTSTGMASAVGVGDSSVLPAGRSISLSGTLVDTPAKDTAYGIQWTDSSGNVYAPPLAHVKVNVPVPTPTFSFQVTPQNINPGDAVQISWTSIGMASAVGVGTSTVLAPGKAVSLSGSITDKPIQSVSYGIKWTDAFGKTYQSDLIAVTIKELPPPPPLGGTADTIVLDFLDGKTLTFTQKNATDVGDYNGQFVHQKCFLQQAPKNGDYRDDFLVYFRPDVDGKRSEIVVEYATLTSFATQPAKLASGRQMAPLMAPPPPKVSVSADSPATQTGILDILVTYITPDGESVASVFDYITLASGQRLKVASPPPAGNAVGWNVYTKLGIGSFPILQNAKPIPFGTDWAAPDTGLLLTGTHFSYAFPTSVAYTATISGGNLKTPITIKVPVHFGRSRWRWQSAPRPIVRHYADLVAMKAILPLSLPLAYSGAKLAPMTPRPWAGPMDTGPVERGMAGAGERHDLGFMTEWSARWLMSEDPGAEVCWRSAAETTGTMAFWVRDVETGRLVDTVQRPYNAFLDIYQGYYTLPSGSSVVGGNTIDLDAAHMPSCAYVPYMITDDPYFLEGAQATATYMMISDNRASATQKIPGVVSALQPRSMAWGWRDVFQVAFATPATTPSWLLPKSYWKDKIVPAQIAYVNKVTSSTVSPLTTVFKFIPVSTYTTAFMLQYMCTVLGWIKWCGQFPEFDKVVQYGATPQLALTDPKDSYGWDHRFPTPYYMPIGDARKSPNCVGNINSDWATVVSPDTATSWADLFACYVRLGNTAMGREVGWSDPANWPLNGLANPGNGYLPWIRAALASLSLAGISGAREAHDWLKTQLDKSPIYSGAKWAVSPDA